MPGGIRIDVDREFLASRDVVDEFAIATCQFQDSRVPGHPLVEERLAQYFPDTITTFQAGTRKALPVNFSDVEHVSFHCLSNAETLHR
jgi:hypothetical protein